MTFKIAVAIASILINCNSIVDAVYSDLNIPKTGVIVAEELIDIYTDLYTRSNEYNKSIENYIVDGGNIPLFTCDNDQTYVGRFYIPDVDINVALYDSWKQRVCDNKDSACFFNYGVQRVVADHWNQGFNSIKQCKIGTKAYISDGNSIERFECYDIIQGHNSDDGSLTTLDGQDIWGMNENGITCYTCNDNWRNITIVLFRKV